MTKGFLTAARQFDRMFALEGSIWRRCQLLSILAGTDERTWQRRPVKLVAVPAESAQGDPMPTAARGRKNMDGEPETSRNQFHLVPGGMMALTTEEMAYVERTLARRRSSSASQRLDEAIIMHEHVISGRSQPRRRQVDAWLAYLMLTDAPWSEVLGDRADEVRQYTAPEMMKKIAYGIPCRLVRPDRRKRLTTTTFDERGARRVVREEVRQ